jgi:hypothetical protein
VIRLLAALFLLGAACSSPDFHDGSLVCAPDKSCPDDFHCASDNHCWLPNSGPDAGLDAAPDAASTNSD